MNKMKEYHNNPFPHLIIDNFLSKDYCDSLINDAQSSIENYSNVIHGGRKVCLDLVRNLKNLLQKVEIGKELERKINSEKIF